MAARVQVHPHRSRARARGLTIIESVLALAILEVAVLAVSVSMAAGRDHGREAESVKSAVGLGDELMEEILAMPYHDPAGGSTPGPDPGERGRSQFDNTDDFHGYADARRVPSGTEWRLYRRRVAMAEADETIDGLPVTTRGLQIAVTVEADTGRTWTITRFVPEPPA